jgi:hypothetical protein
MTMLSQIWAINLYPIDFNDICSFLYQEQFVAKAWRSVPPLNYDLFLPITRSFFPKRMYPSILSFKTINKLKLFFELVFPGLKMWDTFDCATAIFLTHLII